MVSNKTVLVVAAHPDDEVLGCGGTIAKHVSCGDIVHVLIMAEGLTARGPQRDRSKHENELSQLEQSARKANELLGSSSLTLHDFPDNRMDSVDLLDIIKVVETHLQKHQPGIVYTHHSVDLNIDHRLTHQAVVTACRPVPGQCVKTLLFFEVPSSTEWQTPGSENPFLPNWFVDINETLEKKLQALEIYHSEIHTWPHARSILAVEHLACWRGAIIGKEAVEAFQLGRALS